MHVNKWNTWQSVHEHDHSSFTAVFFHLPSIVCYLFCWNYLLRPLCKKANAKSWWIPKGGIFYCGESGPLRCRAGGFLSTLDLCQRPVGEPLWHIRTICLQRALATPAKANQEYRHGFASAEINPSAASSVVVGMWKCHPLLIKAMLLQRPG